MVKINGRKYVKNSREFVDAVFSDSTASGLYKKWKNAIVFYDLQNSPFAAAIDQESKGFSFYFVSCSEKGGKLFFMQGLNSVDAETLGIGSYAENKKLAEYVHKQAKG